MLEFLRLPRNTSKPNNISWLDQRMAVLALMVLLNIQSLKTKIPYVFNVRQANIANVWPKMMNRCSATVSCVYLVRFYFTVISVWITSVNGIGDAKLSHTNICMVYFPTSPGVQACEAVNDWFGRSDAESPSR